MGEDEKPDWIEGFLRQRDAWNAEAQTDPRDAEIAQLRETLDRTERTMTEALQAQGHALRKADALEAQLAAAQADNAALRGALDMAHEVVASVADSWPIAFERVTEALATPAPGAPLLDAVRGLVEAADAVRAIDASRGDDGAPLGVLPVREGAALDQALAAVRAVLSRAQDAAGRSRGGDGE